MDQVFSSFNENLKKEREDARKDIEDCINELYREASVSSTAMIAILSGKITNLETELSRQRENYAAQDTAAGRRMFVMMEASWMDSRIAGRTLESANPTRLIGPAPHVQDITPASMTRAQARAHSSTIKLFTIGTEGPGMFSAGKFWLAEDAVFPKLRTWMVENASSRTLWISSPYDKAGTTSARAAALAVVTAAWQAETPLISHFCQRPRPREVRSGMSIVQVGLVGMVYSLIHQLLQFGSEEEILPISEEKMTSLDGSNNSWEASLEVLRVLLDHTPVLMYCVIDGLNDLEWGDTGKGCPQVLDVLFARQRKTGTVFNILLTTAGQSRVLPPRVDPRDRQVTTKTATEVERYGRRIELSSRDQKGPVYAAGRS
ncbi:hypothetical protein RRF57_006227 [Xylaria bambusicola]|uniref:Uncharacterized protein n=1 Tax=Xylaria bambusicola TaxID=326684 RepID=A0AAN7Z5E6_9PEZI